MLRSPCHLPCTAPAGRFKLNIAMGQFAEAARDALEMARFEQVRERGRKACAKPLTVTTWPIRTFGQKVPKRCASTAFPWFLGTHTLKVAALPTCPTAE